MLILTSIAFTPLIVSYSVEILPYQLRAKGFNVFNFAISLSIIFNQYVNPVALGALAWKYYVRGLYSIHLVYCLILILLIDCVLLLDRFRVCILLLHDRGD